MASKWYTEMEMELLLFRYQEDYVIGHELTHAVTERSSNLIYQYESGALNQGISEYLEHREKT